MSSNAKDVNRITRDFYFAFFRNAPDASIDDAARAASHERDVVVRKETIAAIRREVRAELPVIPSVRSNPLSAPIVEHIKRVVPKPMPKEPEVKPTIVAAPAAVAQEQEKPNPATALKAAIKQFVDALDATGLEFTTFDLSINEENEVEYVYEVVEKRSGKVVL